MQTTTISTTGIFNLDPGCSPWEQRLNTLLSVGLASGADLVEVFLERTDHLGVLAEQDKITSVSPAFGMGAGIRVFRGARDGFVSTNDLSDAGLTEALEQALPCFNWNDPPSPVPIHFKVSALSEISLRRKTIG